MTDLLLALAIPVAYLVGLCGKTVLKGLQQRLANIDGLRKRLQIPEEFLSLDTTEQVMFYAHSATPETFYIHWPDIGVDVLIDGDTLTDAGWVWGEADALAEVAFEANEREKALEAEMEQLGHVGVHVITAPTHEGMGAKERAFFAANPRYDFCLIHEGSDDDGNYVRIYKETT